MAGNPDTSELERVVNLLKRSLELDPRNERSKSLLEEIQYNVPGAVQLREDGQVDYLILTATPVITPWFSEIETPTEALTETQLPPAETQTPEPEPTGTSTTPPLETSTVASTPGAITQSPTGQAATAVAAALFLRKRSRSHRV